MITSEEIKRRLWEGANELRGSMDASRYKDYMLGLMFYKFLSDRTLENYRVTLKGDKGEEYAKSLTEKELFESYKTEYPKYEMDGKNGLNEIITFVLGYCILPQYLYQTWIEDINSADFAVEEVIESLNYFESHIGTSEKREDFEKLFSNLDLSDMALGSNLNERSKNIKALILLFSDLDTIALQKGDVLGDAYEYLIGQFAMESGKKAGEFYTPRQVSEVMAQIVVKSTEITSVYDPTVGSGSLLLTIKKHLDEETQKNLNYYGQEKNTATYNLTRMNLLLHGVKPERMTIKNGDTLAQDWPEDPEHPNEGVQFDAVVMNPPYSLKNWNKAGLKVSDPRFEIAGTLPPDSKGDFAFLLHGLFHLGTQGTMTIVLPHGVLFRGAAEGTIRKRLLEKNCIDTVIGLPANLFVNTGIPVVILVLKKNRKVGEPVLMIDASRNFIKAGKQNVLQEKDIAKIVDTYVERREEKGYSHLASREEILQNEYNLNIPRYVETVGEEIPQDVDAHLFGGIPKENIDDLKALQEMAQDILNQSFKEIRTGYVELIKPVEEITKEILESDAVIKRKNQLDNEIKNYIEKYWNILRKANTTQRLNSLMDDMLEEIKEILSDYTYMDKYNGYQIVAEIWKKALLHDIEIIASSGFYEAGRIREPNIVIKGSGSKKREERDGYRGAIVPNELIAKHLYGDELKKIEEKRNKIQEIENELSDLLEKAKEESTEDNVLSNVLNEAGESFDSKSLKAELKRTEKGSLEHTLLKKVEKLFADKNHLNKEIKEDESNLKQEVEKRILSLTEGEIDMLMYEKWFGTTVKDIVDLVEIPLRKELGILNMLQERYKDTLTSIDDEIRDLEKILEDMMKELVVIE